MAAVARCKKWRREEFIVRSHSCDQGAKPQTNDALFFYKPKVLIYDIGIAVQLYMTAGDCHAMGGSYRSPRQTSAPPYCNGRGAIRQHVEGGARACDFSTGCVEGRGGPR